VLVCVAPMNNDRETSYRNRSIQGRREAHNYAFTRLLLLPHITCLLFSSFMKD